jgi:hypothetical protein
MNSVLETLSLISRLENADKHRQLIVLGHGVVDARSVVTVGGEIIKQETAGFRPDGADIAKFGFRDRVPRESEVTVKISGTATIAIEVAGADGYFVMPQSLEALIGWMRIVSSPNSRRSSGRTEDGMGTCMPRACCVWARPVARNGAMERP